MEMGVGGQGEAQREGEEEGASPFRQPSARPLASTEGGRMSNASRKPGGLRFPHRCHPRPSRGHLSPAARALPPSPQTQRPERYAGGRLGPRAAPRGLEPGRSFPARLLAAQLARRVPGSRAGQGEEGGRVLEWLPRYPHSKLFGTPTSIPESSELVSA